MWPSDLGVIRSKSHINLALGDSLQFASNILYKPY